MSLEALVALLEDGPPAGAMPQLGIDCLSLAGRALLAVPRDDDGEEDGGGGVAGTRQGTPRLHRLSEIQVGAIVFVVTGARLFWGIQKDWATKARRLCFYFIDAYDEQLRLIFVVYFGSVDVGVRFFMQV